MSMRRRRDQGGIGDILDSFFDDEFFRPRRRPLIDWSDSDSEDSLYFSRNRLPRRRSDRESSNMSFNSEDSFSRKTATSSRSNTSDRYSVTSPRTSNLSSGYETVTPPAYDDVVGIRSDKPIKDYFKRDELWDSNIDAVVDEFDKKCTQSIQEHREFTNSNSRLPGSSYIDRNSGMPAAQQSISSIRQESVRRVSSGSAPIEQRSEFQQKSLHSSNMSHSRDRSRILPLSPFITSRFGDRESIFDRAFGDWDSIFPEMDFPDWSHPHKAIETKTESEIPKQRGDPDKFTLHIDVQGFKYGMR